LLFLRQGVLLAQRFDLKKLELAGDPLPQADHVAMNYTGSMVVSAADNGAVAYRASAGSDSQLTWFERSGKESGILGTIGDWASLDMSTDGTRVAAQKNDNGNVDIWMLEVVRGLATRLTSDPADDEAPTWSPDGTQIAFDSNRRGSFNLYQMAIRDIGKETPLVESSQTKIPSSWSSDGRYLLFAMIDEKTGSDLWARPFFDDGKPFPLANRDFGEFIGSFSPDNRWILYESNGSGRPEVYIQSFPELGEKRQISFEGGGDPRWRRDGKEIFYIAPDGTLMATTVSSLPGEKQIRSEKPVPLFPTTLTIGGGKPHGYAVAADGQRFLLPVPVQKNAPPIMLLLNWAEK
jgi:Tol biopolymer transport system component